VRIAILDVGAFLSPIGAILSSVIFIVCAALSVASFAGDLKMVTDVLSWLVEKISSYTALRNVVMFVAQGISLLVTWWRSAIQPIVDVISLIIGIKIPRFVIDAVSVVFFVVGRGVAAFIAERKRSLGLLRGTLKNINERYGGDRARFLHERSGLLKRERVYERAFALAKVTSVIVAVIVCALLIIDYFYRVRYIN
jgi:hypothetical protein